MSRNGLWSKKTYEINSNIINSSHGIFRKSLEYNELISIEILVEYSTRTESFVPKIYRYEWIAKFD
jgi:hypothetical protein